MNFKVLAIIVATSLLHTSKFSVVLVKCRHVSRQSSSVISSVVAELSFQVSLV